jgi:hypothetical protein
MGKMMLLSPERQFGDVPTKVNKSKRVAQEAVCLRRQKVMEKPKAQKTHNYIRVKLPAV